jgi:hypothetical protein
VFEPRARWEPELQRRFVNEAVRVRGCRSIHELSAFVLATGNSSGTSQTKNENSAARYDNVIADVVVLQLSDNIALCLQWIASLAGRSRAPAIVALCNAESVELEWTLRDAGVSEVFLDDASGERIARGCRRLWSPSP